MTISNLKQIFGQKIFSRGLDYYQRGKVVNVNQEGNSITAHVAGSRQGTYLAGFSLDLGTVTDFYCSCPYPGLCKHLAASLIYYIIQGPDNLKEPENPLKHIGKKNKKEKTIPLDFKKKFTNYYSSIIRELGSNDIYQKDDSQRWKLVFILSYSEWNWEIFPALQYRKKDGTPGRIIHYRDASITERITTKEKILLYNSLNREEQANLFTGYLDWILDNQHLPIYLKDYKTHIPLKFKEIDSVHVTFRISTLAHDEIFFMPVVKFHHKGGHISSTDRAEHSPVKSLSSLAVIIPDGTVLYKQENHLFNSFIDKLLRNNTGFSPADIKLLGDFAQNNLNSSVKVSFNAESIKIIEDVPKPVLEITAQKNLEVINLKLLFNYSGQETVFNNKEDLLILKEGREIQLARRDRILEKKIINYFRFKIRDHLRNPKYFSHEIYSYILYLKLVDFLIDFGMELIGEGYEIRLKDGNKKITRNTGTLSLSVSSNIDWLDLTVRYFDEEGKEQKASFDPEYITRGLLPLNNSFVLIEKDDIEKLNLLYQEGLNKSGRVKISKLNFNVIDKLYESIRNKEQKDVLNIKEINLRLKNFKKISNYPLSKTFKGVLRDYQKEGFNWLNFLKEYNLSGCLADDMGLGKTVQTLALLSSLKDRKSLGLILLVVPVTTMANWENEMKRFSPSLKFIRHHGQKREKQLTKYKGIDIILISYQTLRNDIEIFADILFDYIILDESQAIKNSQSRIFKAIKSLQSRHRLSLTGTPVENNTLELWSQIDFLNPGLLGSRNSFKIKYAKKIEAEKDKETAYKLKKLTYPFILRRKKQDVAKDLPPKEEIFLHVEMDESQRRLYHEIRDFYRKKIEENISKRGLNHSAIDFFDALLRLRQFALFPELVSKKYQSVGSCKFDTLKEMVEEIIQEDHKILLFSQFVQSLKIIEKYIKKQGIEYSYLDGSTRKRQEQINRFQENDMVKIFLLSLKAGGVGINLTAADYIILFDPWWNPAVEAQAVDRSHRIGQKKKVIVYKIIVKDTVEEKILKLQERKKELVNEIISHESAFFKSLTKEDVMNIFS